MNAKIKIRMTIGTSDFKKLIDNSAYFVDKTLFIKHVWYDSEIILLPRPRRFGKTLNLSMLRHFFGISKEDKSYLFKNYKIWQHQDMHQHFAKYPVIF